MYRIHSNSTLRISFLLRASWTSVVSSCIIILFASRPPASFLLLHLWSWSLLWGGTSLFQQTSSQPSRLETLRPAHCEQTSAFVSGRVSLVVKDSTATLQWNSKCQHPLHRPVHSSGQYHPNSDQPHIHNQCCTRTKCCHCSGYNQQAWSEWNQAEAVLLHPWKLLLDIWR